MILKIKGKEYQVDQDGFLVNGIADYTEEWAEYVSRTEAVESLTDEHKLVIKSLQDYYNENGIAPMVRSLSKVTGFPLKKIYQLFPTGPGKGACKIAGLPKPSGCV